MQLRAILNVSMPSIKPSPYAQPNTPIASAKRPRTALRRTHGTSRKGAASKGNPTRLQEDLVCSPSPACQLERTSPETGHPCEKKVDVLYAETSSAFYDGSEHDGEDTWKGRVASLFSPVLKFVGGSPEAQGAEGRGKQHGANSGEGGIDGGLHGQENDINRNNRLAQPLSMEESCDEVKDVSPNQLETCGKENEEGLMDVEPVFDDSAASEDGEKVSVKEEEVEDEGMEDEELEVVEEFNPFLFIKQLPPYEHVAIQGKICLPQRKQTRSSHTLGPLTLVLDLDETLVHCTVEPVPDPDVVFPVDFNGVSYQVHVRKRPHLEEFLGRVSKMFEVVVFTASQQVYADALLDLIDPGQRLIKHRLFRDACLPVEGNYIKDLHVLGRDMARTVLIDNSPYAYGYQIDNGIPIESWFEDRDDMELLKLLPFLEELQRVDDVRPLIRTVFQSHLRVHEA